MACDLVTTQTNACTSGIGKLNNPVQLLQLIAQLSCEIAAAGGGGSSGSGQIKTFTANPNTEGARPTNTALPAVAYQSDGTGAFYQWVVSSQTWM